MYTKLDLPVNGADLKMWIEDEGIRYLVKLEPAKAISEHVGSRFYVELGIPAHHTELVAVDGLVMCRCEDFLGDKELRTFKSVHDSSYCTDATAYGYVFNDILHLLDSRAKGSPEFIEALRQRFIDMLYIDALIANRDRHGGNWGYIVDGSERLLAPVFDNAASLFPDRDWTLRPDKQEWYRLTVDTPKSQVQLRGRKKSTFYRLFNEFRNQLPPPKFSCADATAAMWRACEGLPVSRSKLFCNLIHLRYRCILQGVPFDVAYKEVNHSA